jgi:hypothetical protein
MNRRLLRLNVWVRIVLTARGQPLTDLAFHTRFESPQWTQNPTRLSLERHDRQHLRKVSFSALVTSRLKAGYDGLKRLAMEPERLRGPDNSPVVEAQPVTRWNSPCGNVPWHGLVSTSANRSSATAVPVCRSDL